MHTTVHTTPWIPPWRHFRIDSPQGPSMRFYSTVYGLCSHIQTYILPVISADREGQYGSSFPYWYTYFSLTLVWTNTESSFCFPQLFRSHIQLQEMVASPQQQQLKRRNRRPCAACNVSTKMTKTWSCTVSYLPITSDLHAVLFF